MILLFTPTKGITDSLNCSLNFSLNSDHDLDWGENRASGKAKRWPRLGCSLGIAQEFCS